MMAAENYTSTNIDPAISNKKMVYLLLINLMGVQVMTSIVSSSGCFGQDSNISSCHLVFVINRET